MEKVKETIKKLLALANDANDNESQTALLKAQELMLKNNLDQSDIDSVKEVNEPIVVNRVVLQGKPQLWLYRLASIIARNFKVKYYYEPYHNGVYIRFLGIESDVDVAEITYNYALASVKHCARGFMRLKHIKRKHKKKYELRRDYIEGYLHGLDKKFKEQVSNNKYEVALTLKPVVVEKIEELNLVAGKDTSHQVKDEEAYQTGFEDGLSFGSGLKGIEI